MNNRRIFLKTLIFISFLLPVMALAGQQIDFSDPKTIDKLITGKTWNCDMVDAYGKSTGTYHFKTVKGNKVKGSLVVPHLPVCDSDRLKGKLSKNKLKYRAPNGTPCREVNGLLEFNYSENGKIQATGTYGVGGTHKRGSYVCSKQE